MKTSSVPKVAVITRTKDRPILLERAIKSIHRQTMPDFVHIIINDAGDPKIINHLVDKYKDLIKDRVKVIHNTASRGVEAASNKAIKATNSIYIAIHDDDDSWHPDFLKRTTEYLDSSKVMGVVVTTDCITERFVGGKIVTTKTERWLPGVSEISLYKQCLDNYATPITFLYHRSVFGSIGYYDESLPVNGDWEFALRFLMHYDIDFLESEPALANYHHRPDTKGVDGNSVFAQRKQHDHNTNALGNKFMRQNLSQDNFGIGFIVNSMRYQREREDVLHGQIINGVVGQVNKTVDRQIVASENRLIAELNQKYDGVEQRLSRLVIERTSLAHRLHKLFSGFRKTGQ